MRPFLFAVMLIAACGSDKNDKQVQTPLPTSPPPVEAPTPVEAPKQVEAARPSGQEDAPKSVPASGPAAGGHDFTAEGKALLAVGACGDGAIPDGISKALVDKHCAVITKAQQVYNDGWMKKARGFFETHVPKDAPKKVVYPFAGGDLSTALTVYPDADEITTISLEPPGDPRTLAVLKGKALEQALAKVQYELKFLYKVNFSNTMNMIEAMRGGALPTQLIFGLSALKIHGFEFVGLRYFRIEPDGAIHYLDDEDLKKAPDPEKGSAEQRNLVFSNVEVQFKKPNGRVQVWRHMRHNLGNDTSRGIGLGLKEAPAIMKHLEAKGPISAMTKAASYLLSWDSFSLMRNYLLANVVWMVSDATGVAPRWGKPGGFTYETYGTFEEPHIEAGNGIAPDWAKEFKAQQKRPQPFRFGYYDKKFRNHLVIMKKS